LFGAGYLQICKRGLVNRFLVTRCKQDNPLRVDYWICLAAKSNSAPLLWTSRSFFKNIQNHIAWCLVAKGSFLFWTPGESYRLHYCHSSRAVEDIYICGLSDLL